MINQKLDFFQFGSLFEYRSHGPNWFQRASEETFLSRHGAVAIKVPEATRREICQQGERDKVKCGIVEVHQNKIRKFAKRICLTAHG